MREALAPVAARHGVRVAEVDLDAHPDWEERFGDVKAEAARLLSTLK